MFPLSSQDTQYMTSIPQQIQLSPGLIIRAKLQWSTSILPEAFRKKQRKCFWFEEKPKPWVYLVGMGTTQRFFHQKNSFFGSKAVGSTFRWEVIIHLVGFEWWPYLLWKVSNSPRKNSDQQQMRLEKCLTRQLPSVFVVFFCDHWELEMIHDDNSLHWP